MDELKDIAPGLSDLKKEPPFKTPDSYFVDFPARMQMKLGEEKKMDTKKETSIIHLLKPAIGLAASFALIFLLVYYPLKTFTPTQVVEQSAPSEDPDSDMLSIVESIDENLFFALLHEEKKTNDFSDDDLIAYVSANFTDYEIYENIEK